MWKAVFVLIGFFAAAMGALGSFDWVVAKAEELTGGPRAGTVQQHVTAEFADHGFIVPANPQDSGYGSTGPGARALTPEEQMRQQMRQQMAEQSSR